jgi:hypothetical protein
MKIMRTVFVLALLMATCGYAAPSTQPTSAPRRVVNGRPPKDAPTFTKRVEATIKGGYAVGSGGQASVFHLTPKEAKAALDHANRIDLAIGDYVRTNDLSDDNALAMWDGRPFIGMKLDALKMIGDTKLKEETEGTQAYEFERWSPVPSMPGFPMDYVVYFSGGDVVRIFDRR